jgi:hypothetical protein
VQISSTPVILNSRANLANPPLFAIWWKTADENSFDIADNWEAFGITFRPPAANHVRQRRWKIILRELTMPAEIR